MRVSLGLAVSLLLVWSGCTDGSYPGLSFEEAPESPETVTILVGDYGRTTGTKGSGPVENRWQWAQKPAALKVYAFRKDSVNYTSSPGDAGGCCLIDGTLDIPGVRSGREASFTAPEYALSWTMSEGPEVYYPSGKVPYDFFGYSTGGIEIPESSIDRRADVISFPLKIDGTTDLMYAQAVLTESQIETFPLLGILEEEQNHLVSDWSFSSYSASLGLLPVLNFHHALTRICFEMYPGEPGCNKVVIDRVSVTSRDSCLFTVASADSVSRPLGVDFSSDLKDAIFYLAESDGKPLNDTLYHTSYTGDFKEDILLRPHLTVGGGFLLPSEEEYSLVFHTRVDEYKESITTKFTIRPQKSDVFLAGSKYIVRLVMNDLSPVLFDVDVEDWHDGEDYDIGPNQ